MAQFLDLTLDVDITDGGVTAISKTTTVEDQENEEYVGNTLRVSSSGSKFVACKGTDITGKTDPLVLHLTLIEGFLLESNVPVDIKIDGAASGVQIKHACLNGMNANDIEIDGAGQVADIKLFVWGKR